MNNHDGVVTQLEPDILQCEVKWALGSITMNKASGGAGVPDELCQILKDAANMENSAVVTEQERSIFIPIPQKGNAKERSSFLHNCAHFTC